MGDLGDTCHGCLGNCQYDSNPYIQGDNTNVVHLYQLCNHTEVFVLLFSGLSVCSLFGVVGVVLSVTVHSCLL